MSIASEDTVYGYLSADHDRLDALLADACAIVRGGDLATAARLLDKFVSGLRRHIRLEDDVLFPTFERITGLTSGPTEVMREEHRMIEHHLDEMVAALAQHDGAAFAAETAALLAVLEDHNEKEEAVVYPMTDGRLADDERSRLVAALRAFE